MSIVHDLLNLCESMQLMNEGISFKMDFKGFQEFLTSHEYGFEDISTSKANRLRIYSRMHKSDLILTFDKNTNKLLNYSTLGSNIRNVPAIDLTDHFTDGQTPRDFLKLLAQVLPEFKLPELRSLEGKYKITQPKNKDELIKSIRLAINDKGLNCSLNHIDTSLVTDMSALFTKEFREFNGDISKWDVSKVTTMKEMFYNSRFTGDISNWNVSNVKDMSDMFAITRFNGDISKWNVSNVTNMDHMFANSGFNSDISKWDVSNVTNMVGMFVTTDFNQDISKWDVSKVTDMRGMFENSQFNKNISKWDVSNVTKMSGMFYKSKFNQNISKWNVSNVKDMSHMFEE